MEKNTTSSSSICWKIRQALATNRAFRAIHRIKHYYHEPRHVITHSNSPSLPPPQNMKTNNTQGEGAIPIKFDYSTPTSTSKLHGQVSKVVSPQVGKVAAKVEPEPKHVERSRIKGKHNGKETISTIGHLKEQEVKETLDINDTFTEYIERAKYRIRTVSNVGRGNSNSVQDEANGNIGNSGNSKRMENQKDQFADFIQNARKKIRTTSNIGKTSSLKRG